MRAHEFINENKKLKSKLKTLSFKKNPHSVGNVVPKYIFGPEFERTTAHNLPTLLINDVDGSDLDIVEIKLICTEIKAKHVYLELTNAIRHCNDNDKKIKQVIRRYVKTTSELLKDYYVTIDCPTEYATDFIELANGKYRKKFILNLTVKLDGIDKLKKNGKNISIKLVNNVHFGGDNKGIYVSDFKDLVNKKKFIGWKKYNNVDVEVVPVFENKDNDATVDELNK